MDTPDFPKLDSLDIRLMKELESDARQTYKDISAKLDVSRPTVAGKVRELVENNVIRFICLADPVALGYETSATLGIYAEPGKLVEVADRIASCAPIHYLMLCTGRFDIIAWILLRDRLDLLDFLSNELGAIPGVRRVETMLMLQHVKISPKLLIDDMVSRPLENPVIQLDSLDLMLIRELQMEARQKTGLLARKLGTSETTILRRIQRLVDGRVIRITTVIDPFALGYEGVASLGMKFAPDKVNKAAEAVSSFRNVQYVGICTGRYDITAWVMFRKLSDLHQFLTNKVSRIPGLKETETMTHLKIVKASERFLVE